MVDTQMQIRFVSMEEADIETAKDNIRRTLGQTI